MSQLEQLQEIIKACLNNDNNVRKLATQEFNKWAQEPSPMFAGLVEIICKSNDLQIRHFCLVMIRQYSKPSAGKWPKLSPQVQQLVKGAMMRLISEDASKVIRMAAANSVVVIAQCMYRATDEVMQASGKWPELVPFLLKLATSQNVEHRSVVLSLIDALGEFVIEILQQNLSVFLKFLQACTGPEQPASIHAQAFAASYSLYASLADDEKQQAQVMPIISASLHNVLRAAGNNNDEIVSEMLMTMGEIITHSPKALTKATEGVTKLSMEVIQNKLLEPETHRVAMNNLLLLAEAGKGAVRKINVFTQTAIKLAVQLLLDVDDDNDWYTSTNTEDYYEWESFAMGLQSVDRLAVALGGKVFLTHAMSYMTELMASNDWKYRHAGLMLLCECAEGCKKHLKPRLEALTQSVIKHITTDPHVRVRWAGLNCLAQLATDFAPDYQKQFHKVVLPVLIQQCSLDNQIRLVRHSALCIVDFLAGMTQEQLAPFYERLLQALAKLAQQQDIKLQESAIAAMGAVAVIAGEDFQPFCKIVIPGLMGILHGARAKEQRLLRGRTIEAISHIGCAVGVEHFKEKAQELMQVLLKDQERGLDSDDPQLEYIAPAMGRICKCVGKDFGACLPVVIPPLLKSAARQDGALVMDEDADISAVGDGYEVEDLHIRGMFKKKLVFNTAIMEEVSQAMLSLHDYCEHLEEVFFPYVEATAQLAIKLAQYKFDERVRMAAIGVMPHLLRSARMHCEKNGGNLKMIHEMFEFFSKPLLTSVMLEDEPAEVGNVLYVLANVLKEYQAYPQSKQTADHITQVLLNHIEMYFDRAQQRAEAFASQELDERAVEEMQEDAEEDSNSIIYATEALRQLAKYGKEQFVATFEILYLKFFQVMMQSRDEYQRCSAVCMFCDLVAFCGEPALKYAMPLFKRSMELTEDEDADVRQSAFFGIGLAIVKLRDQVKQFLPAIMQKVVAAIQHPEARSPENEPATDNAISVLGKICFHYDIENSKAMLSAWLNYLPCTADEEEAQAVHSMLLDFVTNNRAEICGQQNLPKILSVFANVLNSDISTKETSQNIAAWWQRCQQGMDKALLKQLWGSLKAEDKAKLAPITNPAAVQ